MNRAQIDMYIQGQDTDDSSGFVLRVLCKVKQLCSKAKAIVQHQTPRRIHVVRIYLMDHSLNPANKGQFGDSVSMYTKTCCQERHTKQDLEIYN